MPTTIFALVILITPVLGAQVPQLAEIPTCTTGNRLAQLEGERQALLNRRTDLQSRAAASKASCGNVEEGSAQQNTCEQMRSGFKNDVQNYARDVERFNADVANSGCDEHFAYSGNALVGGTGWIGGYNVQSSDPVIVAKSREMLRQQLKLGGLPYDSIDLSRYNFVLGIAAFTEPVKDLGSRVFFDELSNGNYSADYQSLYNNLKGRAFGELACHSNGAMVCLAALSNHHTKAQKVVLYGPQLTRESLQLWEELVRTHQIQGLDIYVNENDPIPPFSIALGDVFRNFVSLTPLLKSSGLKQTIADEAPDASLHSFACSPDGDPLRCHAMAVYKTDRGCVNAKPNKTVPGTAGPGKKALPEPPPC